MSVNQYTSAVGATGQLTLPTGSFLFIYSATANYELQLVGSAKASIEDFQNIGAGLYIERKTPWKFAKIIAPNGTTISYFVGDTAAPYDTTDYKLSIATITGTVNVLIGGSAAAPTDHADVVLAANATQAIAANAGRKSVTVYNLAASAGNIRVSFAGAASTGVEIQPGTNYNFPVATALTVRDSGLGSTFGYEEFS